MPVGAVIPKGFEAYARILHPAFEKRRPVGERTVRRKPTVRWDEIAARAGIPLRADSSWEELANHSADWTSRDPDEGHLPRWQAEVLVSLLRPMTVAPNSCYFAIWEGWGGLEPERRWPGAATLKFPHRSYVLLQGAIEAAIESFGLPPFQQSASLWWPEDRAWIVATEIDYRWTYVGGSSACVAQILADPQLETQPTDPNERAHRSLPPTDGMLSESYESGGPIRWLRDSLLRLRRKDH